MAIDSRNYYYRVTIEGVQVDYAGEMVMNESLDALTSVVEFELIDQISPRADYGDVVVVTRLNRSDDTAQYQFKGTIREFDAESQPGTLIVRCVGLLDDLNLVRIATEARRIGRLTFQVVIPCRIPCSFL